MRYTAWTRACAAAVEAGLEVVDDIKAASAVLVRVDAPFESGQGSLLAECFRGGSLESSAEGLERLRGYAPSSGLSATSP